jgi:hypothetical protein
MVLLGYDIDFIGNISEDCSSIPVLLLRVVSIVFVAVAYHHLMNLLVIRVLIPSVNVVIVLFFFLLVITIESSRTNAECIMSINLFIFIVA